MECRIAGRIVMFVWEKNVFGMQEFIAQSSPDRRLDSTAQPSLHGVKPTGQWAKHVCLENLQEMTSTSARSLRFLYAGPSCKEGVDLFPRLSPEG